MEILIFITLVIILALLSAIRSGQKLMADETRKNISALREELQAIKDAGVSPSKQDLPLKATDEEVIQWRPYKAPGMTKPSPAPAPVIPEPVIPEKEKTPADLAALGSFMRQTRAKMENANQAPVTESWWDKWVRNNPDLEKFVGENLVNKIGITVLVLGIAFFVKYAIDQNWISETGRVCIGIACGIILVSIAHYLRNSYRSFSSVMAGGGIAVFYFTIAFAYHEYQLFSQTASFVLMIFITAFAVALSLLYNKVELAVIAVVGGFLAPFLVSNGSGNYIVLFSYLLILDIGILIIAYFKKWPLLFSISFFFTWLIFGGWLINIYSFSGEVLPYKNALLFATAFYAVFLATILINNLRTQKPFKAFDFSLLLFISFSYYAQGMISLSEWNNGAYQGMFTLGLGFVNLGLAWYLFKAQKGDQNLLYLLIGLTLTFISLAAPVQLHGHSITLFWSAECVLLYWLHQKSRILIFKYSSALILILMLISLLMDWQFANAKNGTYLAVIFINPQGIVTNIIAIASLALYSYLLQRELKGSRYMAGMTNSWAAVAMAVGATLIFYVSCLFGVNLYFDDLKDIGLPNAYHQLITYLFAAGFLWGMQRAKILQNTAISIIVVTLCFLFYLASIQHMDGLVNGIIEKRHPSFHMAIHWLAAASLLYLLLILTRAFKEKLHQLGNLYVWLINIALLVFFSLELKYLYVSILAQPGSIPYFTAQYLKAGLTIVWAIFSFCIIWLGMKYKYKILRIISLSIFSLALLKLFFFDIRTVSAGGKIAAFIMLGILLLVISFMYQRLKKIIISDGEKDI
jgi:uncharacterized membrane protein